MPSNRLQATLLNKRCKPLPPGAKPLGGNEVSEMIGSLHGWVWENNELQKTYHFKNYYETMAFVNATAWVSHHEDHHPDLEVGYNTCKVRYSTHSVGGLSENDFICAAKVDALIPQPAPVQGAKDAPFDI
jgi:4a-hydroxytetrahydrobiopterin dehydratase